jgi:predicted DCC family thiol-disulfide oxidoreductase YuxK
MAAAVLIYDGDCGFCTWAVDRIEAWDRPRSVRRVPMQSDEGERLLRSVEPGARAASWHLVLPDGRVRSAGRAIEPLLRLLPRGRAPAALVRLFPEPTDRLYAWVARHRAVLGRLVGVKGAATCSVREGAKTQSR